MVGTRKGSRSGKNVRGRSRCEGALAWARAAAAHAWGGDGWVVKVPQRCHAHFTCVYTRSQKTLGVGWIRTEWREYTVRMQAHVPPLSSASFCLRRLRIPRQDEDEGPSTSAPSRRAGRCCSSAHKAAAGAVTEAAPTRIPERRTPAASKGAHANANGDQKRAGQKFMSKPASGDAPPDSHGLAATQEQQLDAFKSHTQLKDVLGTLLGQVADPSVLLVPSSDVSAAARHAAKVCARRHCTSHIRWRSRSRMELRMQMHMRMCFDYACRSHAHPPARMSTWAPTCMPGLPHACACMFFLVCVCACAHVAAAIPRSCEYRAELGPGRSTNRRHCTAIACGSFCAAAPRAKQRRCSLVRSH